MALYGVLADRFAPYTIPAFNFIEPYFPVSAHFEPGLGKLKLTTSLQLLLMIWDNRRPILFATVVLSSVFRIARLLRLICYIIIRMMRSQILFATTVLSSVLCTTTSLLCLTCNIIVRMMRSCSVKVLASDRKVDLIVSLCPELFT